MNQEPKDGDFIAYIEQLQKESAARLLASGAHTISQSHHAAKSKSDDHFFTAHKQPTNQGSELRAALAQIAAPSIGLLFGAVVRIFFGVAFALYWLVVATSIVPLLIGLALIAWGIQRLIAASHRISDQGRHARQVAKVFAAAKRSGNAR